MKYYSVLKLASKIKSQRVKLMGVYAFHLIGRRYLSVFIDPMLTCNLRCRMCYFSDPEWVKTHTMSTKLEQSDIELIAKALFGRAMKVQIGCGAEPQTYSNLKYLVELAKKYGVPHISLTTNGNLLKEDTLFELVSAGLNEITLSCHGVTRETYESFMVNASFDRFLGLLNSFKNIKAKFPEFKIRINYTMNRDNTDELAHFWELFEDVKIDILQLRLFQKIGNSSYSDFDLTSVRSKLNTIVRPLERQCQERGIICMAPQDENFDVVQIDDPDNRTIAEDLVYCYISPQICWKDDFDYHVDTYSTYTKRANYGRKILKYIFSPRSYERESLVTHRSNYSVK